MLSPHLGDGSQELKEISFTWCALAALKSHSVFELKVLVLSCTSGEDMCVWSCCGKDRHEETCKHTTCLMYL
jgi:hypothetical protein